MGSCSDKLFNRERTVHEILGGGIFADVILWRNKNVSVGIVTVTIGSWMVFESFSYTILTLLSSVLLLLLSILFLWSKSASILNRPSPPLPEFQISEEMADEASKLLRFHVNKLLQVSYDTAMGRDSELFIKVAVYLFLISFIGSLMDFQTLFHTGALVVMTVPAFYERYEDYIDGHLLFIYNKAKELYLRFKIWAYPEKKKLS
ncbi:Reticulon-like protein B12 [Raphanus sativus]|uniref:Reticulon-like protein n=1 Tax=Raphanus sativus TaxID=3726 RepID=A0A6J0LH38_RAPSA|nr:reticulon-like protein B12 [Raphanus sativus]KAJ4885228.1 Reticulon-like protein B12 [Raphanus sativus]